MPPKRLRGKATSSGDVPARQVTQPTNQVCCHPVSVTYTTFHLAEFGSCISWVLMILINIKMPGTNIRSMLTPHGFGDTLTL
mgnify:CR=1 FL=1